MEYGDDLLIPSTLASFLLATAAGRYEDDYVVCVRDEQGVVTMTGKPIRSAFIYEGE